MHRDPRPRRCEQSHSYVYAQTVDVGVSIEIANCGKRFSPTFNFACAISLIARKCNLFKDTEKKAFVSHPNLVVVERILCVRQRFAHAS